MTLRSDRNICRWQKPEAHVVKVNWHVVVDLKAKRVGIRVIARDSGGEILMTLYARMKYLLEPNITEALALRRATEVCDELSFTNVIFEGDAQAVIRAFNERRESWAWNGKLYEDIRRTIYLHALWKVRFMFREATVVAHKLAKHALLVETKQIWMEKGLDCILNVVLMDKHCMDSIQRIKCLVVDFKKKI